MHRRIADKREALQHETEQICILQKAVDDAQACEDYLATQKLFQTYQKNGLDVVLTSYQGCPSEYEDWIFDLVIKNMKAVFDNSWNWSDTSKHAEYIEEEARYLVATMDGSPIAFIHFRFEQQDNEFVLFIYDVQIEPDFQRRGLGHFIVHAVEFIALEYHVDCVMTMVFKACVPGMKFFTQMKYKPHNLSPSVTDPEHANEYKQEVLYKSLKPRR